MLPNICISIFSQALIVKSIYLCDLFAFVISSKQCDPGWISDLKTNHKRDGLNRIIASVHIISHEEIIILWQLTTNSEQFNQIMELAVDVTTYGHWSTYWFHIFFVNQNLLCFFTQSLNTVFWQWLALHQTFNFCIKIVYIGEIYL